MLIINLRLGVFVKTGKIVLLIINNAAKGV